MWTRDQIVISRLKWSSFGGSRKFDIFYAIIATVITSTWIIITGEGFIHHMETFYNSDSDLERPAIDMKAYGVEMTVVWVGLAMNDFTATGRQVARCTT